MTANDYDDDLGNDLQITRVAPRDHAPGAWVTGTLAGHRFEALVFATHAESADYELSESRISKLRILRLADKQVVYRFDRGEDCPALTDLGRRIAGFLMAGLAEHVYGG